MRHQPKAIDLCVNTAARGRLKAQKWTSLIAQPKFSAIRDAANDVFYACSSAMCDCPIVEEIGRGGLQLVYEDMNRTMTIKVVDGLPVRYQITVTASIEDAPWHDVPDDQIGNVFFKQGRYVSGKSAAECIALGEKIVA